MTVDVLQPAPMPSGDPSAAAELLRLTSAGWVAQAIAVAAQLRLADLLADGAKDVGELAAQTGTHAPSLYRMLRALASVGIFAEDHDGRFQLTPLATPLRSDLPGSVRAMCAMRGETWFVEAWAELLHSVQTGEPAFEHHHGAPLFAFLADHPAAMALFAEAMTSMSSTECAAVLAAYDFSTATTIVDVGGGHGQLLGAILRSSPSARGVLFDLPATTARAHEPLGAADLTDRCAISSGDFFDSVPDGGDLYVLKSVIHDWDDDRAVRILANCRRAMEPAGTLLLIERVIPASNEPSTSKWMDLNMLVATGGRERTEDEYRSLFERAGFTLTSITPTPAHLSLIDGEPTN
jgi:hypothetical protein